MATFGDCLKELRQSKNLTQKQFAAVVGVQERSYQRYESGDSTPNYKVLISLADYFNVSLDYLTGRTDDPKIHKL